MSLVQFKAYAFQVPDHIFLPTLLLSAVPALTAPYHDYLWLPLQVSALRVQTILIHCCVPLPDVLGVLGE